MIRAILGVILLAAVGCTVKGEGKAASPAWKTYQVEHPLTAPAEPLRNGSLEVRVSKVYLEENKTVLKTSHWVARVRGTLRSPERVTPESLSGLFTIVGKSGKIYPGYANPVPDARRTWQFQEHTGQPTHLPANVPGEVAVFVQVGDDQSVDEPAALTFGTVRVPLRR